MSSFKQRNPRDSSETRMNNGSFFTNQNNRNNRHRGSSLHAPSTQKRETGTIEKLLNSYGFIECTNQNSRIFFHFSEYSGDLQDLELGDPVEFTATADNRNNKPVAIRVKRLPEGSVASDSLSDRNYTGIVECEAQPGSPGGEEEGSLGRVSYDRNGEFFFLLFSPRDVETGGTLTKGDKVSFHIATDRRTGTLQARKITLMESIEKPRIQGIVSSLKDAFGFIERADLVNEIFFHYSEFNGEIADLTIGDDVEFSIQQRKDKEVGIQVKKLPCGTVAFEDISSESYQGKVIKPVVHKQSPRGPPDGQLSGVIEYNSGNDTKEVLYGERDTEGEISLRKADTVEFNISTDRRDGLEWAVNIKMVQVSVKNGQIRETGIIASLKEGFGFIKCCDRDLSLFFHFSELLEQAKLVNAGDEVEFAIEQDAHSNRSHATRIRILPKGTVNLEVITKENCQGVVDKEPQSRMTRNVAKPTRDGDSGIILYTGESEVIPVWFKSRDCRPRENPQYGDIVKFDLVTFKRTGQFIARDVAVLQKSLPTRQQGYICAVKESYGFIEFANHEKEVFFHYSELDCDPNELSLGDEVEFFLTKKNGKPSSERVVKLPMGTMKQEDILPEALNGVVIKPMRILDPEQDDYQGLIEISNPSTTEDEAGSIYSFSITSLVNKKEPLQTGDKVAFQVVVDPTGVKQRATNVTSVRNIHKGKIESVKGQYGFITFEADGCKNLFFHMSEVADHAGDLQAGDVVEFVVVKCHKNAKQSAIQIRKIPGECQPRPALRKRVSLPPTNTTCYVIRTPSGPDGSRGFKERQKKTAEQQQEDNSNNNNSNNSS